MSQPIGGPHRPTSISLPGLDSSRAAPEPSPWLGEDLPDAGPFKVDSDRRYEPTRSTEDAAAEADIILRALDEIAARTGQARPASY